MRTKAEIEAAQNAVPDRSITLADGQVVRLAAGEFDCGTSKYDCIWTLTKWKSVLKGERGICYGDPKLNAAVADALTGIRCVNFSDGGRPYIKIIGQVASV